MAFLTLASFGFIAIFAAIFYTEYAFLAIAFLTPLSVNIEEYTNSFGLFIPTEPLLFGLMLLFLMINLKKRIYDVRVWKNPIIWAVTFYLFWAFITSITSSLPMVSFKFLLARLWFIIPMLFLGSIVFQKEVNIKRFMWLYAIGMMIAIAYTLVIHASYSFGEKEGHWVMWPFFKDHTIYGAMVAFNLPVLVGLYFSKKHLPLVQAVLISFILLNLVGLYFSYKRAAWLSVVAALGVLGLIYFRIKFNRLDCFYFYN